MVHQVNQPRCLAQFNHDSHRDSSLPSRANQTYMIPEGSPESRIVFQSILDREARMSQRMSSQISTTTTKERDYVSVRETKALGDILSKHQLVYPISVPVFNQWQECFVTQCLKLRTFDTWHPEEVVSGCLLSFSQDVIRMMRRSPVYTDQSLFQFFQALLSVVDMNRAEERRTVQSELESLNICLSKVPTVMLHWQELVHRRNASDRPRIERELGSELMHKIEALDGN